MASLPNTNQTEPNIPVPPLTIPKKLVTIFSYLSILFWAPIFICKDNPTIKFHIRQGFVLFLAEIVTGLVAFFDFRVWLGIVISLLMCTWIILSLLGIKN